jgi:hypothetical protein
MHHLPFARRGRRRDADAGHASCPIARHVSLFVARHSWLQRRSAPHDGGSHVVHTGTSPHRLLMHLSPNVTSRHTLMQGTRSVREALWGSAAYSRHRRALAAHRVSASGHVDRRPGLQGRRRCDHGGGGGSVSRGSRAPRCSGIPRTSHARSSVTPSTCAQRGVRVTRAAAAATSVGRPARIAPPCPKTHARPRGRRGPRRAR